MGANGRVIYFNLLGGTGRGRGKTRLECTFLEIFFSYGNEMAHFSILCSNQLSYLDRLILSRNQPFYKRKREVFYLNLQFYLLHL